MVVVIYVVVAVTDRWLLFGVVVSSGLTALNINMNFIFIFLIFNRTYKYTVKLSYNDIGYNERMLGLKSQFST